MRAARTFLPLLLLTPAAASAQAATDSARVAEVRAVADGFDAALAAGDSLRALAYLHPDATVYEGGHAETREEYRRGHLGGDIGFLENVATRVLRDDVVVQGEMALYTSEYAMKGTYRDREIDRHGTETMVLVRTSDGWRIRHIHWSSR